MKTFYHMSCQNLHFCHFLPSTVVHGSPASRVGKKLFSLTCCLQSRCSPGCSCPASLQGHTADSCSACPPGPPGPSAELLPSRSVHSLCCHMGLFCPRCKALIFIRFLSAHSFGFCECQSHNLFCILCTSIRIVQTKMHLSYSDCSGFRCSQNVFCMQANFKVIRIFFITERNRKSI